MKYMVITAKHHEGFAMYDSKLTDYNIVKATPYGRDPLKDLAAECARQDVKFCLYYSVKDRRHPEYPTLYTFRRKEHPDGFHGFPNPNADYLKYLDYMQGQLRELMTNYGPIGTLFFDWSGDAFENDRERRRDQGIVDMNHQLQPSILINNRLAGIGTAYGTPEQEIPDGRQASTAERSEDLLLRLPAPAQKGLPAGGCIAHRLARRRLSPQPDDPRSEGGARSDQQCGRDRVRRAGTGIRSSRRFAFGTSRAGSAK